MSLFKEILTEVALEYGTELSEKQLRDFDIYYEMLLDYNQKVNLTAITQPEEVAVKHIIDSLTCWRTDIFSRETSVLDLGTGAGFPGLPLKIFKPDLELTLMDSLKKRLVFLEEVTDRLGLKVKIIHKRAETAGKDPEHRGKYQIVVSRAVARMSVLSEYSLPLVSDGGWFIALKGANFEEELSDSEQAVAVLGGKLAEVVKISLPRFRDKRAVIYVRKISPTPASYPRREGIPEKKPL